METNNELQIQFAKTYLLLCEVLSEQKATNEFLASRLSNGDDNLRNEYLNRIATMKAQYLEIYKTHLLNIPNGSDSDMFN